MVSMEGINGEFREINRDALLTMSRVELVDHLEFRGTACYDDESTKELRECALLDFAGEHSLNIFPEWFSLL